MVFCTISTRIAWWKQITMIRFTEISVEFCFFASSFNSSPFHQHYYDGTIDMMFPFLLICSSKNLYSN